MINDPTHTPDQDHAADADDLADARLIMRADDVAYARLIMRQQGISIHDLDLDAFADGIIAQGHGVAFHENPHPANALKRLSWAMGWNERALMRLPRRPQPGVSVRSREDTNETPECPL